MMNKGTAENQSNSKKKGKVIKNTIRQIFSVYIHNTKYYVYNIEGKEHEGLNDTPKTWWLYFDQEWGSNVPWGPTSEHPPLDSKNWTPWDVGIKRSLWEFEIKQTNSHKIKWDYHRFSNHITVNMICNKKKIYSFGTFDMAFALSKLQYLKVVLSEHPYNFFETEKELGRKIYYYGLPATVRPNNTYPGEIGIVPEYSDKLSISYHPFNSHILHLTSISFPHQIYERS